ncbi:MAG: aldo/keto reductase [Candidatus Aminicenantes bacterium]|nr:MAG: aldo/keto reductase [Candidatus Aminicenantes bacterium]
MSKNINGGMNRRRFLKNSAIGLGAAGIGTGTGIKIFGENSQQPQSSQAQLKIKEYRTLGRTGFKVSDISSGYVDNPAVLERMLNAGINYIDSAESYGNESMIGTVVKKRDRESVFITTKLEIKKDLSKEGFLSRARKCLERLQTDYVDCIMMHCPEKVETLKTEGFHAAMQQLKNEGKLRFVGVANHGTNWYRDPAEPMEKVLTAAAMDGRFDVMLLAYNFIQDDNGAKVLRVCREKNIGTTLMKVNPIGNIPILTERIEKLKKEGKEVPGYYPDMIARLEAKQERARAFIQKYKLDDYNRMRDAAIRFCLSNPDVHTVCRAFRNFDHLEAYIPLSGTRLDDMEKEKLSAYKRGCGALYCRHACGICEPACPHHVPINTIMRYNHYFEAQGKEKYAMKSYAGIKGAKADLCTNCSGFCEPACPYDVPIHGLLNLAHRTLTLNLA